MRGYRRTWAVCGCLLALAALEGCSGPDRQPVSRAGAFNPRTDGRITLQVELPRDTVSRGDRSAVQFFYYVVNGPEPVRFSNQPGNWQIRLETQDGTAVPGTFVTSGATGWLDAHFVLPARAIFGQVGDLRCFRDAAGYTGDPVAGEECLGFYELDRAGTYRIIVEYSGPDLRQAPLDDKNAAEDTATVTRRRPDPPSFRMADTATLVVTDR
jgi:hypothetical protein